MRNFGIRRMQCKHKRYRILSSVKKCLMRTSVAPSRRRRDSLTIMTDLLETMALPTRLTHILYRTNLSYPQLKKHLELLVSMGFVQEIKKPTHSFVVTEKGRMFVQLVAPYPKSGVKDPVIQSDKIKENLEQVEIPGLNTVRQLESVKNAE